jgi:putative ABC transport system permease protein
MRKKTIGSMLFYENLIMSIVAIVVGIVIGTLLSKVFAMILVKLLDSSVQVSFQISMDVIVKTVIVFAIIILITFIQAYRLIYRFKLIELFQAAKEGEQAPKASMVVAGAAVVLLSVSYWLVFQPIETTGQFIGILGSFFVMVVIGTYLLFHSSTVYLLKLAQKRKSRYYRGMNMVGTSQLLYRIKGNARTFAMVALLSGLTICLMSIGYSSYYNIEKDTNSEYPFSYTHISQGETFDSQVEHIIGEDNEHPVIAQLDIPIIVVNADVTKLAYQPTNNPSGELPTKLISERTFTEISAALDRDEAVHLSDNEAAIIKPQYTDHEASGYVGREVTLRSKHGDIDVELVQMLENRVMTWGFPDVYLVVSDEVFSNMASEVDPFIFKVYSVENQKSAKETSMKLEQLGAVDRQPDLEILDYPQVFTYYSEYREGLESAGLDIFLLGFLGLVFLAATGSMVYFKQLTDAHTDKARYEILRKIGVSRGEIYRSIAKQTLFVFALPLTRKLPYSFQT